MKVLIVGLGSIAKKHLESLKAISVKLEIFALRRINNFKNSVEDVTDILKIEEDHNFDFAIISNPTSEHANTIKSLIEFGIPLFIEKPLFSSLNFDDLITEVQLKKIRTYVACNLRFLDSINFVKSIINEKEINEVNIYCGSYLPDWRPNLDFRTVYSANKNMGGGVHIDLIHEIDYLIYLFGFPDKVQKTFKSNSSLNITSYDYSNYLLEYTNYCANIVLNYYRRTPKRIMEIVCKDGEYEVNLLTNSVYWNGKIIYQSEQRIKDTYIPQMNYFINNVVLDEEYKNFNDISEAYKILKLCLEN